jgi:hypothetical protein
VADFNTPTHPATEYAGSRNSSGTGGAESAGEAEIVAPALATAVLETNVSLSPRALARLRAVTVELADAIDASNRYEATLNTIEDADENGAYQDSTWWPSLERRERAGKAFASAARRCKVGVVVLGGRIFADFLADASECEEPVNDLYAAIKLDRLVVLG